jgi:fumarate reductase subunit C
MLANPGVVFCVVLVVVVGLFSAGAVVVLVVVTFSAGAVVVVVVVVAFSGIVLESRSPPAILSYSLLLSTR